MGKTIAMLHPGEMGAAIGAGLAEMHEAKLVSMMRLDAIALPPLECAIPLPR